PGHVERMARAMSLSVGFVPFLSYLAWLSFQYGPVREHDSVSIAPRAPSHTLIWGDPWPAGSPATTGTPSGASRSRSAGYGSPQSTQDPSAIPRTPSNAPACKSWVSIRSTRYGSSPMSSRNAIPPANDGW